MGDSFNVIFLGSSSFALPSLQVLLENGISPLIITKPDRPAKRGKKLQPTSVKERALQLNLPILQPSSLSDPNFKKSLKSENPDLMISIAYGEYIPKEVLAIPRLGCINLHPSLLPKYRGAAPVQRALMAGAKVTGVTIAYVEEDWDAGDILLQETSPIDPNDNAGSLLNKLAIQGGELLLKTLHILKEGRVKAEPQDHSKATYAPKIKDEETMIKWNQGAEEIRNFIRALSPSPGARSKLNGMMIKISKAKVIPGSGDSPGKIVELEKEGPVVSTKQERLLLLEVQPENRKLISGKDFINGNRLQVGQTFES